MYCPRVPQVLTSPANKYYYKGSQLAGFGSTHTPVNNIWPLATMVRARDVLYMHENET